MSTVYPIAPRTELESSYRSCVNPGYTPTISFVWVGGYHERGVAIFEKAEDGPLLLVGFHASVDESLSKY